MTMLNWDMDDDEREAAALKPQQKPVKQKKKSKTSPSEESSQSVSTSEVIVKDKKNKKRKSKEDAEQNPEKTKEDAEPNSEKSKGKQERSKGKFTISTEWTDTTTPPKKTKKRNKDAAEEVQESADVEGGDEEEKPKKTRKTVTALKRKSIKYKERKRKRKIDSLRSTMPKAQLEEFLKPHVPEEPPKQAALNYLRLWKSARQAWKFHKVRQVWLLQNIYKSEEINNTDFQTLLEYMEPLKGLARNETVKQATELLEKHKDSSLEESKMIASRATQILQILD